MNSHLVGIIITIISGLSTMLGCFLIFVKYDQFKIIKYSLLLSSFIMLSISILELIPSSFGYLNKIYDLIPSTLILAIYVLFGGILVFLIDKSKKNDNKLYKIGIISFITLILHNIPEGIITFISTTKDVNIGIFLSISIALHNIPEGIAISIPIYYGNNNKKKAIVYTLIASLSEPLGAFVSLLFVNKINDYLFAVILSLTAGIMIYLSLFELFKESFNYKKDVYL